MIENEYRSIMVAAVALIDINRALGLADMAPSGETLREITRLKESKT